MARTWGGYAGARLRVLYLVPDRLTQRYPADRPAPESIVRVLVGRLEIITRDTEAEVEQLCAIVSRTTKPCAARPKRVSATRTIRSHTCGGPRDTTMSCASANKLLGTR
jgi:hypothetical protein